MSNLLKDHQYLAVGAAAVIGFGSGILFKDRYYQLKSGTKYWKSFSSDDVTVKYALECSLRMLPVQERLMEETVKSPFYKMMGAPEIAQFLGNLLKTIRAKRIIEIGVFRGLTTLQFALALPDDGKIVACELREEFVIGKPFWKEAGVDHKIDLRIQRAEITLNELLNEGGSGTYDFAFIDADKEMEDVYYEQCLQLVRCGGIISIDSIFWGGTVLDGKPSRFGTSEAKALYDKLKNDPRVYIHTLAMGDGFTLIYKR